MERRRSAKLASEAPARGLWRDRSVDHEDVERDRAIAQFAPWIKRSALLAAVVRAYASEAEFQLRAELPARVVLRTDFAQVPRRSGRARIFLPAAILHLR